MKWKARENEQVGGWGLRTAVGSGRHPSQRPVRLVYPHSPFPFLPRSKTFSARPRPHTATVPFTLESAHTQSVLLVCLDARGCTQVCAVVYRVPHEWKRTCPDRSLLKSHTRVWSSAVLTSSGVTISAFTTTSTTTTTTSHSFGVVPSLMTAHSTSGRMVTTNGGQRTASASASAATDAGRIKLEPSVGHWHVRPSPRLSGHADCTHTPIE